MVDASSILGAVGRLLREPAVAWGMLVVLGAALAPLIRSLRQAALNARSKNWPELPAIIDVVSVVEREDENKKVSFVATLTYFYRNPDLQMGEYERSFELKSAADAWAEQFKSRQIMVRVNPRRPEESVLPVSTVKQATLREAPSLEEALRMEKIPELPMRYRTLSAISELIGVAGLVGSASMLLICVRRGGAGFPAWMLWTAGAALAFTIVSFWVVTLRAEDEEEYSSFLHSYALWLRG